MGRINLILCLSISTVVGICFLMCVGCTGSGEMTQVPGDVVPAQGQTLNDVLLELDELPAPVSTDEDLFAELKSELSRLLESSGQTRFTSRLSVARINDFTVVENEDGTMTISWSYSNVGDYDLNGEVNLADIASIAIHYRKTVGVSDWDQVRHVDGDGNGEINIADITPIAIHYNGGLEGYLFQTNRYPGNETTWETAAVYSLRDLGFNDDENPNQLSLTLPLICPKLALRVMAYIGDETGEGSNSGQPEEQPEPEVFVISGTILDPAGTAIAASIAIQEMEPILADEDGNFSITVEDSNAELVANFTADGYANTTKILSAGSSAQQNYSITMKLVDAVVTVMPMSLSILDIPNSATVTLPPGALVDSMGMPMLTSTEAELTFFDPTDPVQIAAAPGDLTAIQLDETEVVLETYGMLEVRIDDGIGGLANLAEGQEAPVTFPVAEEMRGRAPQTIGLYSFDEETNKWIEEGIANLDSSGEFYLANVTHFSTWNCDFPQTVTAVHVLITNLDGIAMEGVEVVASGVDYSGDRREFTDENGIACLLVKRDSVVDITAEYFGFVSEAVQVATPDTEDQCENPELTPLVASLEIPVGMLFDPTIVFTANPAFGEAPLAVNFDATDCFDRDGGQITKYEWNFDVDANPLDWQDFGDTPQAQFTYDAETHPETHITAGVRATDDTGQVNIGYVVICLHEGLGATPEA